MRIDRRLLQLAFGGLFWRTFLLIALLISVSLAAWFQSFRVIEREPRAQRVALQLVAVVKLTRTACSIPIPTCGVRCCRTSRATRACASIRAKRPTSSSCSPTNR